MRNAAVVWGHLMTASLLLFTATVVRSEALAQPYGEQFSHLIKVRNRDPLAHNFTSSRHSMNPAYFGSVKLPVDLDPNHLPDACSNFAEECAMEAAGRFEAAFAGYETRLSTCGLAGWRKVGNLGSGNVVTTMLLETPCGLRTAVKAYQRQASVSHITNHCHILKELLPEFGQPYCQGCIPKYYYYSSYTGACFEEYVHALSALATMRAIKIHSPEGEAALLHLFAQGVGALLALQRSGVVHKDLMLSNMLVRLPAPGDIAATEQEHVHAQLMFIDFGWATSRTIPERRHAPHNQARNMHTDTWAYACEFYRLMQYGLCIEASVYAGDNPAHFRSLLEDMLVAGVNVHSAASLDLVGFHSRVSHVTVV